LDLRKEAPHGVEPIGSAVREASIFMGSGFILSGVEIARISTPLCDVFAGNQKVITRDIRPDL
jgi:hypothetical protein